MVTASSIGAGKGGDYGRYLESKTVEPERGDYYLNPTGEPVQAPGRWLADEDTLRMLGITPGQSVVGGDFIAVMDGRHPVSGQWLRPEGAGGGRAAGIDVTFSAPKSVSAVWALADPWQRETIEAAHTNAVQGAIGYMRDEIQVVRRRRENVVVHETARDLIAAEYVHTTARGVSGAEVPDPQLHSHVVISGVIRQDDRIAAVSSRPIFRSAREVGAYYRTALAWQLRKHGYAIEQATGNHGRYFELADVPVSLREEFSQRAREVAQAIERFRAKYGRAPERGELRHLKLENRKAKQLTTRHDLQQAWQQAAREHGFGPDQAAMLISAPEPSRNPRLLADRVEERLTERAATFEARELRATVLEQAAGELPPERALQAARGMVRERRVLPLEGGLMTTLEIRAKEQAIERHITQLAQPAGRDTTEQARERATRAVSERIGAPLTREQREALELITGPERWAVLIGQAGTGKGVVIDAAARAEQDIGRQVFGVAIAGATAERLGHDSPSLQGHTMTVDALLARAGHGRVTADHNTTVFYDEAGMSDTSRLERFTRLIAESGAKAVTIGDPAQLPSIGAGGMFERIINIAPTAQLETVHRTHDHDERKAWAALRHGDPAYAMAHYQSRGQLQQRDTRELAAEAAVQRWAEHLDRHDPSELVILSDSSNHEVDRLNARAQHLRHQRGQLGEHELPHPERPYTLREHDRVIFAAQHHPVGQPRVENGSLGRITHIHDNHFVTVTLDATGREIQLAPHQIAPLRLAYAQHISRQQGATVQRAVALTGGWQTSRETSYVQASRVRHGIDWFIARDDLGHDGTDPNRINRLAERMRQSRRQTPSLHHAERSPAPARDYRSLDRGLDRAPSLSPGWHLLSRLTRPTEHDTREPDRAR
jgi:conjugative relaxase-like TrwC/TraI family protein